jgi:hypothetical protein
VRACLLNLVHAVVVVDTVKMVAARGTQKDVRAGLLNLTHAVVVADTVEMVSARGTQNDVRAGPLNLIHAVIVAEDKVVSAKGTQNRAVWIAAGFSRTTRTIAVTVLQALLLIITPEMVEHPNLSPIRTCLRA